MASAIIHLAIAKKLNEKLNRDPAQLYIGTIAPDISKLLGETKLKTHFLDNLDNNIPNLDKFLDKYEEYLDDDFVMGYYIHLLVDYMWFKYFLSEFSTPNSITTLDGNTIECDEKEVLEYIYNDYTNLNIKLIDAYNLDLKIFYNNIPKVSELIEEIPVKKIKLIVRKTGEIIKNSKDDKVYTFNIENVINFIEFSTEIIENELFSYMNDKDDL